MIKAIVSFFTIVLLGLSAAHAQLSPLGTPPAAPAKPVPSGYVERVDFGKNEYVGLRYVQDAQCKRGQRAVIEFVAGYEFETLEAFERMLVRANKEADCLFQSNGKPVVVGLVSPGGVAMLGVRMGHLLQAYNVHAVAGTCISSCSIAWFMAPSRAMLDDGEIGVHAPYIPGKKKSDPVSCSLPGDDFGKWIQSILRSHLGDVLTGDYKVADEIFYRMFAHCSASSADMITKAEAKRLGLI